MNITINRQTVCQGSYGIRKINQRNGVDRGPVITVWHVHDGDNRVGTFATRKQARDFAFRYRRLSDSSRRWLTGDLPSTNQYNEPFLRSRR